MNCVKLGLYAPQHFQGSDSGAAYDVSIFYFVFLSACVMFHIPLPAFVCFHILFVFVYMCLIN